jgi:hypothetical protein
MNIYTIVAFLMMTQVQTQIVDDNGVDPTVPVSTAPGLPVVDDNGIHHNHTHVHNGTDDNGVHNSTNGADDKSFGFSSSDATKKTGMFEAISSTVLFMLIV